MEIVVIDGQGGGIGKNIIQVLKEKHPEYTIIGVGTNSMATTQLKKGGADIIATGETTPACHAPAHLPPKSSR